MNRLRLAAAATTLLLLAGCGGDNQDQVDENAAVEQNAPAADLDLLANDAADSASERDALEEQQQQLNLEAETNTAATTENTTEPEADEDIQGM